MSDTFITPEQDGIRQRPNNIPFEQYISGQSVFGTSAALNFYNYGITANLANEARILQQNGFSDYFLYGELQDDTILSPLLSADQATAIGSKYGMTFNAPIRQGALDIRLKQRRDEISRQSVLARAPKGITSTVSNVAGGFFGALADPANVAASFIPVVREARFARMVSTMGVTRARATTGAIEGAVGATLLEPLTYTLTQRAQADYDMYDSLINVAFGTVLGSGLHVGAGYIKDRFSGKVDNVLPDRIDRTDIETKRTAMRVAFSDALEGRDIDVEPVLRADPAFDSKINVSQLDGLDYRMSGLSADNIGRIERRFENSLIYKEGDFPSRSLADNYIRTKAKEEGLDRGVFFVERNGDVLDVHRAVEALPVRNKDNAMVSYKSYEEANAEAKRLETETGVPHKVIKLKPEKGKSLQTFHVVQGIDDKQAKLFNEAPTAIVRKIESKPNQSFSLRNLNIYEYSQKKFNSSSLVDEAVQIADDVEFDPDNIDSVLEADIQSLKDLDGFVETSAPYLRTEIDAAMKIADDELAEAQKMAEAIKSFGACMVRG